jgi:hypothetical protein
MIARQPTSEDVLDDVGHIMVRSIAKRVTRSGDVPAETHALFDVAMADKLAWSVGELAALTHKIDTCKLKVRDWLLIQ